jgi:hypothetical protein
MIILLSLLGVSLANAMPTISDRNHSLVELYSLGINAHIFPIPELNNCSVPGAKQFVYFSPAFIFENLPRGPPNLVWNKLFYQA